MGGFGNLKNNNVSFSKPITAEKVEVAKDDELREDDFIDHEIEYKILTGQKKKLLFFLIKSRSSSNPALSGPIMYNDIAKSLKISKESVPVILNRLVKTGLIERFKTKYGRTGYAIFKYSPYIRRKFQVLQ